MAKAQCKECEEMGHFVKDCPNKKCRNCEKPGHAARDCPVSDPYLAF
jgi:Zinc knuckle